MSGDGWVVDMSYLRIRMDRDLCVDSKFLFALWMGILCDIFLQQNNILKFQKGICEIFATGSPIGGKRKGLPDDGPQFQKISNLVGKEISDLQAYASS